MSQIKRPRDTTPGTGDSCRSCTSQVKKSKISDSSPFKGKTFQRKDLEG